ncbi:MAG: hypothetical protein FWG80_04205 [Alphaproteobacteria bacterium]|nr:hypothetical protein [Alphaproteobacteria bacterium]
MKRLISFLFFAIVPQILFANYEMQIQILENEIAKLTTEKQEKYAQLEKCASGVTGFKIAGISLLGLTAVGVGVNVYQAVQGNQLNTKIGQTQASLDKKLECEKAWSKFGDCESKPNGNWGPTQNAVTEKELESRRIENDRVARSREECEALYGEYVEEGEESCMIDPDTNIYVPRPEVLLAQEKERDIVANEQRLLTLQQNRNECHTRSQQPENRFRNCIFNEETEECECVDMPLNDAKDICVLMGYTDAILSTQNKNGVNGITQNLVMLCRPPNPSLERLLDCTTAASGWTRHGDSDWSYFFTSNGNCYVTRSENVPVPVVVQPVQEPEGDTVVSILGCDSYADDIKEIENALRNITEQIGTATKNSNELGVWNKAKSDLETAINNAKESIEGKEVCYNESYESHKEAKTKIDRLIYLASMLISNLDTGIEEIEAGWRPLPVCESYSDDMKLAERQLNARVEEVRNIYDSVNSSKEDLTREFNWLTAAISNHRGLTDDAFSKASQSCPESHRPTAEEHREEVERQVRLAKELQSNIEIKIDEFDNATTSVQPTDDEKCQDKFRAACFEITRANIGRDDTVCTIPSGTDFENAFNQFKELLNKGGIKCANYIKADNSRIIFTTDADGGNPVAVNEEYFETYRAGVGQFVASCERVLRKRYGFDDNFIIECPNVVSGMVEALVATLDWGQMFKCKVTERRDGILHNVTVTAGECEILNKTHEVRHITGLDDYGPWFSGEEYLTNMCVFYKGELRSGIPMDDQKICIDKLCAEIKNDIADFSAKRQQDPNIIFTAPDAYGKHKNSCPDISQDEWDIIEKVDLTPIVERVAEDKYSESGGEYDIDKYLASLSPAESSGDAEFDRACWQAFIDSCNFVKGTLSENGLVCSFTYTQRGHLTPQDEMRAFGRGRTESTPECFESFVFINVGHTRLDLSKRKNFEEARINFCEMYREKGERESLARSKAMTMCQNDISNKFNQDIVKKLDIYDSETFYNKKEKMYTEFICCGVLLEDGKVCKLDYPDNPRSCVVRDIGDVLDIPDISENNTLIQNIGNTLNRLNPFNRNRQGNDEDKCQKEFAKICTSRNVKGRLSGDTVCSVSNAGSMLRHFRDGLPDDCKERLGHKNNNEVFLLVSDDEDQEAS